MVVGAKENCEAILGATFADVHFLPDYSKQANKIVRHEQLYVVVAINSTP